MLRIEPSIPTQTPINTNFRNKTTSKKLATQKLTRFAEENISRSSQDVFSRTIKPNSEYKKVENFVAQEAEKVSSEKMAAQKLAKLNEIL